MTNEIAQRIAFSAFCLGTVTAQEVGELIGVTDANEFAIAFNEWLKEMPKFVLAKWDGVHYDAMKIYFEGMNGHGNG